MHLSYYAERPLSPSEPEVMMTPVQPLPLPLHRTDPDLTRPEYLTEANAIAIPYDATLYDSNNDDDLVEAIACPVEDNTRSNGHNSEGFYSDISRPPPKPDRPAFRPVKEVDSGFSSGGSYDAADELCRMCNIPNKYMSSSDQVY